MTLDEKIDGLIKLFGASVILKRDYNETHCRNGIKRVVLEEVLNYVYEEKPYKTCIQPCVHFNWLRKLLGEK